MVRGSRREVHPRLLVKVRFAGLFRRYAGEQDRTFDIPDGSCSADLLRLIGEEYGERLPPGLWDAESNRFHRSVRLARLGSGSLDDAEMLSEADEILVIFALAGG